MTNQNTIPPFTPKERTYYRKKQDRATLRRKGRGRKTNHVTDGYRERYELIFGDQGIFRNLASG
jgi:hypothetical protein